MRVYLDTNIADRTAKSCPSCSVDCRRRVKCRLPSVIAVDCTKDIPRSRRQPGESRSISIRGSDAPIRGVSYQSEPSGRPSAGLQAKEKVCRLTPLFIICTLPSTRPMTIPLLCGVLNPLPAR